MAAKGIASVGECMIELSGADSGLWRMGFAGDSFNTLWALRALTDETTPADYVSAFGDDPFSRDQIAFLAGASIGPASTPSRCPAPSAPSPTGAPTPQRGGWPTTPPRSRKVLRTGRLSIFPESVWQFSNRRRGDVFSLPWQQPETVAR
jgi:hypothetical protein